MNSTTIAAVVEPNKQTRESKLSEYKKQKLESEGRGKTKMAVKSGGGKKVKVGLSSSSTRKENLEGTVKKKLNTATAPKPTKTFKQTTHSPKPVQTTGWLTSASVTESVNTVDDPIALSLVEIPKVASNDKIEADLQSVKTTASTRDISLSSELDLELSNQIHSYHNTTRITHPLLPSTTHSEPDSSYMHISDLESKAERVDELEKGYWEMVGELESCRRELSGYSLLHVDMESLAKSSTEKESIITSLNALVGSLRMEIEQMREKPAEYLERFNDQVQQEEHNPFMDTEVYKEIAPKADTESDLEAALECIAILQSSETALESQISELITERDFLRTELTRVQIMGDSREVALAETLTENELVHTRLEESKGEITTLKVELDDLYTASELLETSNNELYRELAIANEKLQNAQIDNFRDQGELVIRDTDNAMLKAALEETLEENRGLHAELDITRMELSDVRKDMEEMDEKLALSSKFTTALSLNKAEISCQTTPEEFTVLEMCSSFKRIIHGLKIAEFQNNVMHQKNMAQSSHYESALKGRDGEICELKGIVETRQLLEEKLMRGLEVLSAKNQDLATKLEQYQ